jgi:hypothetical protein
VAIAGQPEYVGVIVTTTLPARSSTSRSTPRSSRVSIGISGSVTEAATARAGWSSLSSVVSSLSR